MKKILNFLSVGLILIHAKIVVFAEEWGIFWEFTDNANEKLKKWVKKLKIHPFGN